MSGAYQDQAEDQGKTGVIRRFAPRSVARRTLRDASPIGMSAL